MGDSSGHGLKKKGRYSGFCTGFWVGSWLLFWGLVVHICIIIIFSFSQLSALLLRMDGRMGVGCDGNITPATRLTI